MWINASDAVDLYAKDANASLDGSISAPSVSGELLSDPLRYRYDGDPLRMQGTGHLDLGLASQGASDETTRAPGQASTAPPLVLAPSGSFDVAETSGVQVTETTSAWNPLSWFGQGTWIVLAVLGAVAIGAGVGATAPVRVHGALGAAYEGWRAYQYKRWTLEARMMLEERAYERAEDLFSKAQALDPKAPDAYEGLMDTYDVASEPDKALDVAETAIEEIGRDRVPNTFVRMWMEFASRRGTSEHVVEAWLILADRDPEWAVALYAQGDHAPLHEDERVAAKIEQMRDALLADNPELAAMLEGQSPGTGDDEAPGGPEIA